MEESEMGISACVQGRKQTKSCRLPLGLRQNVNRGSEARQKAAALLRVRERKSSAAFPAAASLSLLTMHVHSIDYRISDSPLHLSG